MSDAIQASVQREGELGCVVQLLVSEPALAGKQGVLKVEHLAHVKRGSPVHAKVPLATKHFTLAYGLNRIPLGDIVENRYTYAGHKLDLRLTAHIEIDDSVLFDTKLELDLGPACRLPARASVPKEHAGVHSPRDRFNFIANLRAIPAKARLIVIWLIAIGLPIIAFNMVLGARDQMVPESQAWFYDHSDSDGESESPLMKALMGSGAIGVGLWVAIRAQLRKYMTFNAQLPSGKLAPDLRVPANSIISGQARVPLQHAVARVVAYNREHGQYTKKEKQGKSTRTVTKDFTENARGVVLYEQALAYVPANVPLHDYLEGEVPFAPIFESLYPPYRVTSTHGLSIHLEAQLIHPEFVDHDIELPIEDARVPVAAFYGEG